MADLLSNRYKLNPIFFVAPILGQSLDIFTTRRGLKLPGTYEANPLVKGWVMGPAFPVVKIGLGVLTGVMAKKLARDGHPNWAKTVSILGFAAGFIPALNNARVIQKRGGW